MQVTEEAMAQVRGTGRDGGRLYADIVRERRVSTANRFEVLQGEKRRDEVIYMGATCGRPLQDDQTNGLHMTDRGAEVLGAVVRPIF